MSSTFPTHKIKNLFTAEDLESTGSILVDFYVYVYIYINVTHNTTAKQLPQHIPTTSKKLSLQTLLLSIVKINGF